MDSMPGMGNATAALDLGAYPHPKHGGWLGHMLPGWFFTGWGAYMLLGAIRLQLAASSRSPYRSRGWYEVPWGSSPPPLEPLAKVLLTFIGINGELWFGHESYRRLVGPDGRFMVDNINEWQHSSMYAAFLLSGVVDLIGHYGPPGTLPLGAEQAGLAVAFLVEGLLFAFHLEGEELNKKSHFLLVLCIFAAVAAILGELRFPGSPLLGIARAQVVLLQGLWFMRIATMLFEELPAWHPRYHGSQMMAPVTFCFCILGVAAGTLALYVAARALARRRGGPQGMGSPPRGLPYSSLKHDDEDGGAGAPAGAPLGGQKEVEVLQLGGGKGQAPHLRGAFAA